MSILSDTFRPRSWFKGSKSSNDIDDHRKSDPGSTSRSGQMKHAKATQAQPADPGLVAQACVDAEFPSLAKQLIDEKISMRAVQARLSDASEIRLAVDMARSLQPEIDPALADKFVIAGAGIEHVRTVLFDMLVDMQSGEIFSGSPAIHEPESPAAGWERAQAAVADPANGKTARTPAPKTGPIG